MLKYELKLMDATVPSQPDFWSCGHRCVVHAAYILEYLQGNSWKSLPQSIPKDAVSTTAFRAVCEVQVQDVPNTRASECRSAPDDDKYVSNVMKQIAERQEARKHRLKELASLGVSTATGQEGGKTAPSRKRKQKSPKEGNQDEDDAGIAAKKSRQMSTKEREHAARAMENELSEKHEFTHNHSFQREHRIRKILMPRGHWQQFLLDLHDKAPMGCEACRECRKLVSREPNQADAPPLLDGDDGSAADADQGVPPPPPPPSQPVRARGRPKKSGASWPGLKNWLESTRPGIYQVVEEGSFQWLCRLCNQVLKFQRDADTFVKAHEKRALHISQLAALKAGVEHALPRPEEVATACQGVDICNDSRLAPELHKLQASIAAWIAGGSPLAKGNGNPLGLASFTCSQDGITFRHVECEGQVMVGLCPKCYSLSRNSSFIADLKHWAWKLDLVQLCNHMVMNNDDEIRELAEAIPSRDYFDPEVHKPQLDQLLKMNPADAIGNIRYGILSIPRIRRAASLQALIDLRLSDTRQLLPTSMESSIFSTLMQKFQGAVQNGVCHRKEFEMASMIASGKLRAEPVVEALFKSTLSRLSKISNGALQRTGTSEFFANGLSMDLLLLLGKSKESHKLLQPLEFAIRSLVSDVFFILYNLVYSCISLYILIYSVIFC